jgi:hypothetical protein
MLQTQWVKISTYLQSETFLSVTFLLINIKFLIMFCHNRNVLCYVVLSYPVLVYFFSSTYVSVCSLFLY